MKTNRGYIYGCVLAVMIVLLMAANLVFGSVDIPVKAVANILFGGEVEKDSWQFIVWESRVPQCITALLCGTALSASGLMLQTVFSNPLADSSILGISSEASLGVALVLLAGGGSIIAGEFVLSGFLSVVAGAFAGAALVMAIILSLSAIIKNTVMLLIAGIMIGYVVSSIISLLNFFSTAEGVHSFVLWGMGSFGGVSMKQLPGFSIITLLGLLIAVSCTLSNHRRISMRSYNASRLLSASGSSLEAATSRRIGIFSTCAPLRNWRSLMAVSKVLRIAGPAFQISSRKTISASGR